MSYPCEAKAGTGPVSLADRAGRTTFTLGTDERPHRIGGWGAIPELIEGWDAVPEPIEATRVTIESPTADRFARFATEAVCPVVISESAAFDQK